MGDAQLRIAAAAVLLAGLAGCVTVAPHRRATVYENPAHNVTIAIFEPGLHLSEVADRDRPEATGFGYQVTDCSDRTIACLSFAGTPMGIPRTGALSKWSHAESEFEVVDVDAAGVATIMGRRNGREDIIFRYERTRGVVEFTLRPSGRNSGAPYRLYSATGLLADLATR